MNARDSRHVLAARRYARRRGVFSSPPVGEARPRREPRVVVLGRLGVPADPVVPHHPDEHDRAAHVLDGFAFQLEREAAAYSGDVANWLCTLHGMAFDERVNASAIHEACAASGTPIDHRFKQSLGLGVRAYLERVRLRAARLLLADDAIALQTVALAVGYANYETFNRAVNRRMGRSPSRVRHDMQTGGSAGGESETASKNEETVDDSEAGQNVKAERQLDGREDGPDWTRTGTFPLRRRRIGGRPEQRPGLSPLSSQPAGLMTITDVKGYPTDDGGVSRIDIEGDSPHLDKLEVTLEVTGKQLKRSVTVRKDRTWTARFKESDGVDLLGFSCGTLVRAGASSKGDAPQHVVWTGCVRSADEPEEGADTATQSDGEPVRDAAPPSSDGQPVGADGEAVDGSAEPLVLVRRGEGGGDQAVVTVTVGRQGGDGDARRGPRTSRPTPADKRTRRRRSAQAGSDGPPRDPQDDAQQERRSDYDGPIARRNENDVSTSQPHARDYEEAGDYEQDPYRRDDRDRRRDGPADERRRRERSDSRDEERSDARPARRRDDRSGDRRSRRDRDGEEDGQKTSPGRDAASWVTGSLVMIVTALFLFSIAAQAFPIMVGLAAALAVPAWAFVLATATPASWARWAGAGVGLAALAIPSAMPFVAFVEADVYLVAAGIAALGIAIAASLLFFRTGDDGDDERDD